MAGVVLCGLAWSSCEAAPRQHLRCVCRTAKVVFADTNHHRVEFGGFGSLPDFLVRFTPRMGR